VKQLFASAGLLVLVASVQAASVRPPSAPSFTPKKYPTAKSAQSVAIGDLNGDRRPDLVAAHGFGGGPADKRRFLREVSVLLNRGGGRFGTARVYPTGKPGDENGAWSVAIGDLDGDGNADLATANPGGRSVSVLVNLGDGRFQPTVDYPIDRKPWDVAIKDLNGDGNPDVVTANPSTVSVLLNKGDGTLSGKLDYPTGRDTWALVVGDLNGDRKPDLATANHKPSTVSVLINRGDGGFKPSLEYGTGPGPTSLAIGDLNGDRRSDLVTANGSSNPEGEDDWADTISVLLNRGGGMFRPKRDYRALAPVYNTLQFSSVAIADLNGDAKPDIATADGDDFAVSALLNRGDGRFRKRLLNYESTDFTNQELGYGARAIAIGDLSGDGRPDVVTPRWAFISVFVNTPGLCTVPRVEELTLAAARKALARAHCRLGKIRRVKSYLKSGDVFTQSPEPATMLRRGGIVNLWVSNGERP
jgi:hypothetical protein